jgi:hypothetical protein
VNRHRDEGNIMVKSAILRLAVVTAALLCVFAFAFVSCGRSKHPAGSGGFPTADSALAELDALACPEGVESALWAELKGALKEALSKTTSTPPTGDANRVNDLGISDNGNGTYTLTWRYRNTGDYGQEGTVGIEDITPIALHFGETYDPETEPESIQAVVDGSGNGKVGIEDVTQIAMYYAVNVHHYAVEGVDDYEQPYVEVAQATLPAHDNIARLELTHDLGEPPYQYWRVVPVDEDGNRGQASNVVSTVVGEPPEIISVSPTEGDSGTEATFSAEVTGDGPFEYYWNFGGGASPNQSTQLSPTVTLSRGGTLPDPVHSYPAVLTVNTPYGSASYAFSLSISAWWHIEEIPKVPGHEGITSASYVFGPDGSLWGKQSYSAPAKSFLVRIVDGQMVEYEEVEGTLAVDSLNNPARMYRVETGFLTYDYYFSRRVEGQWSEGELLESGVTGYMPTQVFFDSSNQPVIVYTLDSSELWVARRTAPGVWEKKRVWEAAGEVNYANAEIRVDDRLELVFSDAGTLCYGKEEQGNWLVERLKESFVDEEDYTHRFFPLDIALNVGSEPSILFGEVEYGSGYYPTTVFVAEAAHIEAAEHVYYYSTTSPALLPGLDALAKLPDTVLVTFNDPSQSNQFFAWRCESVWTSAVFPTPEFYGAEVRVAADGMPLMVGQTHIARHW